MSSIGHNVAGESEGRYRKAGLSAVAHESQDVVVIDVQKQDI